MPARSDYTSSDEEQVRHKHISQRRSDSVSPRNSKKKHKSRQKIKQEESESDSDVEAPRRHNVKHRARSSEERDYEHRPGHSRREPEDFDRKRRIKEEPRDDYERRPKHPAKREPEDRHVDRPLKRERRDDRRDRGQGKRDRGDRSPQRELSRWETSRDHQEERKRNDRRREENRQRQRGNNPFDGQGNSGKETWGRPGTSAGAAAVEQPKDKEQPNFELSGKLTEDTNTFRGVVIKYNEPEEARKPKRRWRLYPFKGDDALPVLHIHRQSAYLLGRDRKVADIPVDHPSCSKQHAVLQFRLVGYERDDGTAGRRVRPYIIDLESSNGTFLNNKKIEPKRYFELMEKDVLKFGFSSREYVLLHDSADTSEIQDDDVQG